MDFKWLIISRALHITGIVVWIGGVFFVTMVLLPALKDLPAPQRLPTFERLERRFGWYARLSILITGASGLYLAYIMDLWDYLTGHYWPVLLMMIVWGIFALMLFVLEPFVVHKLFHRFAVARPELAFKVATVVHWFLLSISMTAVITGMMLAHGYPF